MPSVCEGLLQSRARGAAAAVSAQRPASAHAQVLCGAWRSRRLFAPLSMRPGTISATVNEAFMCACRFEHEAVASLLLERSIALDPELGKHTSMEAWDASPSSSTSSNKPDLRARDSGRTVEGVCHGAGQRALHDGDLTAFVRWRALQREPWLLGEAPAWTFRRAHREGNAERSRGIHHRPSRPRSRDPAAPAAAPVASHRVRVHYAKTHLIPLLTRIWPLPDDLPHAAGMGDLARVKRWFDESEGAGAGRSRESLSLPTASTRAANRNGAAPRAAGARHRARLVRHQPSLRRGGLPARARRRHQHQLELPRAGEHPAPSGLSAEPTSRCDSSSTAAST